MSIVELDIYNRETRERT